MRTLRRAPIKRRYDACEPVTCGPLGSPHPAARTGHRVRQPRRLLISQPSPTHRIKCKMKTSECSQGRKAFKHSLQTYCGKQNTKCKSRDPSRRESPSALTRGNSRLGHLLLGSPSLTPLGLLEVGPRGTVTTVTYFTVVPLGTSRSCRGNSKAPTNNKATRL